MDNKVILISIDGMRPDGFLNCGNPFIKELMARSTYTLTGSTVFPSVTLPATCPCSTASPPLSTASPPTSICLPFVP